MKEKVSKAEFERVGYAAFGSDGFCISHIRKSSGLIKEIWPRGMHPSWTIRAVYIKHPKPRRK